MGIGRCTLKYDIEKVRRPFIVAACCGVGIMPAFYVTLMTFGIYGHWSAFLMFFPYTILFALPFLYIIYRGPAESWLSRLRRRITWYGTWRLAFHAGCAAMAIGGPIAALLTIILQWSHIAEWTFPNKVMLIAGAYALPVLWSCPWLGAMTLFELLRSKASQKLLARLSERRTQAQERLRETAKRLTQAPGYRNLAEDQVEVGDLQGLVEREDPRIDPETAGRIRVAQQVIEETDLRLARLRAHFRFPVPADVPLQPEEIEAMQAEETGGEQSRQVVR